jgi:CRISPR-associated protein Cmr3
MSGNKKYFIRLKPTGLFFFGTGIGSEKQDYMLSPALFPQQTALLGLIRFQLLLQNNVLVSPSAAITDKKKAEELAGKESFNASAPSNRFGIIRQLSPCGIFDSALNEFYLPHEPMYASNYTFNDNDVQVFYGDQAIDNSINKNGIHLPAFDHKGIFPLQLKGNKGDFKNINDFLDKQQRPGITKDYSGKTQTDAYYKQEWLYFKRPQFSFAFYIELSGTPGYTLENNLVHLGKEKSGFSMTVTTVNDATQAEDETKTGHLKIILTSDAYVNGDEFMQLPEFAVNSTTPFRNFINRIEQPVKDYYNKRPDSSNTSNLLLLKRGSVFFFRTHNALKKAAEHLNTPTHFKQIGYNHFITL